MGSDSRRRRPRPVLETLGLILGVLCAGLLVAVLVQLRAARQDWGAMQRTIRSTTDTPSRPREILHNDAELAHQETGVKLTLRIEVERDAAWTKEEAAEELLSFTQIVLTRARKDGYR